MTSGIIEVGDKEIRGNLKASGAITAEQLESVVATGAAPLVVASTTLVANLNVAQLGGASLTALVQKVLFNANTILKADSDDTPAALTVPEQTLVGRITAGNIAALTAAQGRTLLNVADGADVTGDNAPQAHKASHENAGADEISVAGLSGLLADDQHVLDAEVQSVIEAASLADLSDVDSKTGLGAIVVMSDSPGLTTPYIRDDNELWRYMFIVSELTANRTVLLPLLTGDDEFVFKAHTQTLVNKTFTEPTIASHTNAQHDHSNATGGGALAAKYRTRDATYYETPVLATRTIVIKRFEYAATLVAVHHEVESDTATWMLEIRTDLDAAGTDVFAADEVSTTTHQTEDSFAEDAIPADAYLVLVPTSKTGTPDWLAITPVWTIN